MNKYLFVDIDGVLNNEEDIVFLHETTEKEDRSEEYTRRGFGISTPFSDRNVNNLKHILEETGADVVLSSTWRRSEDGREAFQSLLESIGYFHRFMGCTPVKYYDSDWGRGREITEWLEKHATGEYNYAILDDDCDMNWGNCMEHFIHINGQVGLTYRDRYKAIEILNKGEK